MGLFKSKPRRTAKPAKTPARQSKPRNPQYDAVEIQFAGEACRAAQDVTGKRYLCDRAPILPLNDCDRPQACACRYGRYSDRRDNPRRKSEGALPTQHSAAAHSEERRRDQGRRSEELDETGQRRSWFKNI